MERFESHRGYSIGFGDAILSVPKTKMDVTLLLRRWS